jgi:predicted metal-binding protein
MIRTGEIQDLLFPTYHFENTPEGIWMLQMALAQSQYDSAKKGRDVKRGMEQKATMGTWPAPAPLGYLNDKYEERGKKKIYVDKDRFPLLRKMVDVMLTGNHTPPQILKLANEEWSFRTPKGKKMSLSTIYNIFTRPFYYGEFEWPIKSGNWYKGTHTPLMTKEEYDQIQFLLGRKDSPRPKTHRDMAYRGAMRCGECGALVTAEHKYKKLANGGVAHYIYYHCTKKKNPDCTQKCVEEKALENQIDFELEKVEIPEDFKKWALNALKEANSQEITDREQIYSSQRKEYEACVRKIDNLIDMRANEEIDASEFMVRKEHLLKEKERYTELLKDTDQRVTNWLEIAERGFNFAERAVIAFEKAKKENNIELKKEIFYGLGSDYKLKDGKLSISIDDLLIPLQKASSELQKLSERLEPKENVGVARDFGENYSKIPQMLPVLE